MSLARLSAGSGYRYLLRHIACGDACREPRMQLTAYYAASGYPAGCWLGAGLKGLDDGRGLAPKTVVTEEGMAGLYGKGHDPVSGKPLGMAYPAYKNVDERVAEALAELPDSLTADEREAQRTEIETVERARPTRAAVAGFDLTFTIPKSASVLWALGDETTQLAVVDAHREAVTAVLDLIEQRFLHTRVGAQGCAQVATGGMIAAAFDHWDTRTGDPNLHTHVVIANKVQGPDGKWRSLDSRALHHSAVACSEIYDDLLADALATRLPVTWSWRSRGERRSPAFEIDGLDDELLRAFSGRAAQIETHLRELVTGFIARHDRDPNRVEILRLRQQATLASRPDKTVLPLTELFGRWRSTASTLTGESPHAVVARALHPAPPTRSDTAASHHETAQLAEIVLHAVTERRSTWTRPNLLAEAARATRHLRAANPAERVALIDRVVTAALEHCVPLDPPAMFSTPRRFQRADASSTFIRPDEHAFTTTTVLEAEARLLAALDELSSPSIQPVHASAELERLARPMPGRRDLTRDQEHVVLAIATSGRRLEVLVGPAGTGKTRALRALRTLWESAMGPGTVVGLAASSTAAAELAAALGIPCENTAKWLHENAKNPESGAFALCSGQVLIVDEASMVATGDLDRLVTHAGEVGAKVVLVGDHHQLGAVGAGGAFALLADTPNAQALTGLWRFRHRWEANATRALREGAVSAIDLYADHSRIHDGPAELMLDRAYTAWATDIAAGHTALLLAADNATVNALNTRAQEDHLAAGIVQPDGIALSGDATAGRGDVVVTRRNDRRLPTGDGGYVRNGALWRITDVHPDGALDVTASNAEAPDRASVRLPADYVREHVELGYAATIHRAQGTTVDRGHVVASAAMTRQSFYVAMTRGREANHAYVALDGIDPTCPDPTTPTIPTGRQILAKVLATDGAELSATATLRHRQLEATSLRRLLPIRETLTAGAATDDPERIRSLDEVQALITARATAARAQARTNHSRQPRPQAPRHHRKEGIQR